MSWVSIDVDKCNECGLCILRCPRCFLKGEEAINAHADENTCNLCGHCIALCPTDAIEHKKMDMGNFISIEQPISFNTDEFIGFIRQRRSHRIFKEKEIPRETLQQLIDICRYAPTGSNVQTVEIIIVQDPDRRQRLSELTIDCFDVMGKKAENKIERLKKEGKLTPAKADFLERTMQYRENMLTKRDAGLDPIFYRAPAVVIFHSPTHTSTPKDNCVIASTTMGLVARTMGLETTYIGLFEMASKAHPPLIEELGLPEGHEVFSCLIMGYPKLRFLKMVDRTPVKTKWE